MDFLRVLEGIRFPLMDKFMSVITYMGDEVFFMALALLVFWCIGKRQGYYLFAVGLLGTVGNQFLKLWFRIPRPWVLDPNFTIVEAARAGATGYSFPSGHTQSIVGTLGAIAICNREKWVRILCAVFIILVPFSRMYLGVHTPLDVIVGFAGAVLLLVLFYPVFRTPERAAKNVPWLFVLLIAATFGYLMFTLHYNFPADVYTDPDENLAHGIHNGYTILGALGGLLVSYFVDNYKLRFSTKAPLLGQILKLVLGLGLIVAIKGVLKAPLLALFNGNEIANCLRYFIIVVFGGCIWPMTFPFFAKLGKQKETETETEA